MDPANSALRNGTDLDGGSAPANGVIQGEDALRGRAEREVNDRVGDVANAVRGPEQ